MAAKTLEELLAELPKVVTDPTTAPQNEEDIAKLKAQYAAGVDVVANQAVDVLNNIVTNVMNAALDGPLTMKQRFDALGNTAAGKLALINILSAVVKSQRPKMTVPSLPVTHTYVVNPDGTVTATEK